MKYDAFISYSHDDKEWALTLAALIRRRRRPSRRGCLSVFLDLDSIGVGDNWVATIEKAIQMSRHIIPVFSPSYFRSKASGWELLQRLIPDFDAQAKAILPCLLFDCDIPPRLSHIQYLDFRSGHESTSPLFAAQFERLVAAIKGTPPRNVTVDKAAESPSTLLPEFPYFVYISDSKLEMLETLISRPVTERSPQVADGQRRFDSIKTVIWELEKKNQIGLVNGGRPYIAGDFPMKWGVVDWGVCDADIRVVFFFTSETDPIILMAGSVRHILGSPPAQYEFPRGAFGYSGSHLPGIMQAIRFGYGGKWANKIGDLLDWVFSVRLCREDSPEPRMDGLPALCFPTQKLSFVARLLRRIRRPTEEHLAKYLSSHARKALQNTRSDVLICTPLYVALSEHE
ncbi:MAG: toll/interleukin-1 receptor domain-containing protein [Acidobacteriia bacterium]|nr:toll/interleukin-1 receptor domain-containing protein [Terriglobia bacterium]